MTESYVPTLQKPCCHLFHFDLFLYGDTEPNIFRIVCNVFLTTVILFLLAKNILATMS